MTLAEFIAHFKGARKNGKGYTCYCPVHERDGKHNPSLSITESGDKILLKCFAGCETIHILASIGLGFQDLFTTKRPIIEKGTQILAGRYSYTDENGKEIYYIEKLLDSEGGKSFRPRHIENGKVHYNLEGIKRYLYNLPKVLEAVKEEKPIYICEGEKDCDIMQSNGLTATTNTFGAQAGWEDYYAEWLAGADIIIIEDKDEAGKKHTKKIKNCLTGKVRTIKVLRLPDINNKKVKDAFDFIDAGGTAEDIQKMLLKTKEDSGKTKEKLDIDLVLHDLKIEDYIYIPRQDVYHYEKGFFSKIDDEFIEAKIIKLIKEPTIHILREIMKMFKLKCLIPNNILNKNFNYLNLKNGILNVESGELEEHRKDIYSTIQLPITYNSNANCERWMQFVNEVLEDQDLIDILQEFIGLCLLPDTKFEKCLLLYGEGSNGKSIVIKILQYMLGEQNFSTVLMSKLDSDFSRATMKDKLINCCGELEIKEIESSAYFKAIVSGDSINAAFKNKDHFIFKPFCRLVFACNELPKIKDRSYGFFRRFLILPFKKTFTGENADNELETKLIAEIDGIFNWALQGVKRLYENNRFTHSSVCVKEIENFQKDCNTVLQFLSDCCEVGFEFETSKKDFYDNYKKFCQDNGLHFLNNVNFWKEIKKKHPELKEIQKSIGIEQRARYIVGITYNENK